MGVYTRPSIVTNGLVLNLDAANTKSYPGSGTTWSDLSGNRNNGTLTNGPTFSRDGGGSVVLDGIDDNITTINTGGFNVGLNNFTIGLWIYLPSSPTWNYIHLFSFDTQTNWALKASDNVSASSIAKIYFYGGSETYRSFYDSFGTWNLQFNVWQYVCITRNSSTHKAYYNGSYVGQYVNTPKSITCTNINLGIASPGEVTKQRRGPVQFYNRALSDSEITQNYNALKSRFNLS